MTDSLVQRLREAIDETERIAQAAQAIAPSPWRPGPVGAITDANDSDIVGDIRIDYDATASIDAAVEALVIRHDPASVLRRCAADRELLDAYEAADREAGTGISPEGAYANGLEFAVRLLAEAYGVEA